MRSVSPATEVLIGQRVCQSGQVRVPPAAKHRNSIDELSERARQTHESSIFILYSHLN